MNKIKPIIIFFSQTVAKLRHFYNFNEETMNIEMY